MAGFMDMFGGGDGGSSGNSGNSGMFGGMFGGGDVYGDLLTDEQKQRMQQQTMMTMAAKLLQAGGPSTTPTNLGQALGGAFLSGQEAYGKAGQNAVQGMLTKQKIEEYRADKTRQDAINKALFGGTPGLAPAQMQAPNPSEITFGAMPQSSAAASVQGGMQQGGMQQGGMQQGGMQGGNLFSNLTQQQRQIAALTKPSELPALLGTFAQGNAERTDKTSRQMTPAEVSAAGLPLGTVAKTSLFGGIDVVRAPNQQVVQTPEGGTAVINLDAIASGKIPTTPAVQRAARAPAVPNSQGTTARASVSNGVTPLFEPALKPEQMITESRDWTKNYFTPVQSIITNYQTVLELQNSGSGGITDYGTLIKSIKALEPNSAVMQGEADSAKSMMSLADRMSAILEQAQSGGLGSDVAREQLANLARASVKTAVNTYNSQLNRQKNIYSAGRMPENAINAILSPIQMPSGAASIESMRQQIQPKAPQYPPNVMRAMENGGNVQSDGKGNFIYLDPQTNTWKPIQ